MCKLVPEHLRETACMPYEDIKRLPTFTTAYIAKRLTVKVASLATQPRGEPKEPEQEVGWAGHDAFQVTSHHEAVIEGRGTDAQPGVLAHHTVHKEARPL